MSPQPSLRAGALVLAVGCVATGCSASPTTGAAQDATTSTAGTGAAPTSAAPTSLSLGVVPGLADAQVELFQDELAASGEAVSLTFDESFDVQHVLGAEQDIVRAVADGTLDLGWVGVRAFSELGVHDLDALIAPMAVPSVEAQQAVLSSDLPDRMLAGLEPLGVTGLALLGGPLRRPIAAGEPLTTLEDFSGIHFYSWHGDVNAWTVEALGAANVDTSPEERNAAIEDGSIQALENTTAFLVDNPGWPTNAMTLNLGLWPSASVLVANPEMVAGLPAGHRAAVVSAAEATGTKSLEVLADEQRLVAEACQNGATFGMADAAALADIEAALEPVLEQLRTHPVVAGHLDEIQQLTQGVVPVTLTVPDDCTGKAEAAQPTAEPPAAPTAEPTDLDGTYVVTWAAEDLTEALGGDANPDAAAMASENVGTITLTFDAGRYDITFDNGDSCPGTFVVDGDRVVLTSTTRLSEWDCGDGMGEVWADATWNIEGDTLSLTDWNLPPEPAVSWFARALLGTKPLARQP